MSNISNFDLESEFDRLACFYTQHAAINHPSKLHGLLTGTLSGGQRLASAQWLSMVLEHMGAEQFSGDAENPEQMLKSLYDYVLMSLDAAGMEFQPMLPDDETQISERLEALGLWIRGFLEGLALSVGEQLVNASEDIQELLRDLVSISQVDADVDDSEENERELLEVSEYLRVAVMNIFAEFNSRSKGQGDASLKTLH